MTADEVRAAIDAQNNDICHHGIKGQKWGIRNFQNPDGSLTSKGRAHYNNDAKKSYKNSEELYKNSKKNNVDEYEKSGYKNNPLVVYSRSPENAMKVAKYYSSKGLRKYEIVDVDGNDSSVKDHGRRLRNKAYDSTLDFLVNAYAEEAALAEGRQYKPVDVTKVSVKGDALDLAMTEFIMESHSSGLNGDPNTGVICVTTNKDNKNTLDKGYSIDVDGNDKEVKHSDEMSPEDVIALAECLD